MKRVCVVCKDNFLWQKIYLILRDEYIVTRGNPAAAVECDVCLWNTDDFIVPEGLGIPIVTMGIAEGMLRLPFSEGMLISALESVCAESKGAILSVGERSAYLRGREIALTEVEFALFSRLMSAAGGFTSRDELIRAVWGEGADGGVLNVYIHYLREKLEVAGEKIIISSRKNGYKIDEKYLSKGGAPVC